MKKVYIMLTAVAVVLSLSACGGTDSGISPAHADYQHCMQVSKDAGGNQSQAPLVCADATGYTPGVSAP
jgi:hypothetical protein